MYLPSAAGWFGAALRLDPDCIGLALMKKREWQAALNELRQAHELTSANSNIRLVYEAVLYAFDSR